MDSFSWKPRVLAPSNQGDCNSCWALVLSEVMTDRFRIHFDTRDFPLLSPMALLRSRTESCCSPDDIYNAIRYIENEGLTSWCCDPYIKERLDAPECQARALRLKESRELTNKETDVCAQGSGLTRIPMLSGISRTERGKSCDYETISERYFIKKGTARPLSSIAEMKAEIRENGPVVAVICMYPEFIEECRKNKPFETTGGIYMRRFPGFYDVRSREGEHGTMHTVAIIGWGVEKVQVGEGVVTVPYWEVRNSWGVDILTNGYQKIAFSSAHYDYFVDGTITDVNVDIGIDSPIFSEVDGGGVPVTVCSLPSGCGGMHTIGRIDPFHFRRNEVFADQSLSSESRETFWDLEYFEERSEAEAKEVPVEKMEEEDDADAGNEEEIVDSPYFSESTYDVYSDYYTWEQSIEKKEESAAGLTTTAEKAKKAKENIPQSVIISFPAEKPSCQCSEEAKFQVRNEHVAIIVIFIITLVIFGIYRQK